MNTLIIGLPRMKKYLVTEESLISYVRGSRHAFMPDEGRGAWYLKRADKMLEPVSPGARVLTKQKFIDTYIYAQRFVQGDQLKHMLDELFGEAP